MATAECSRASRPWRRPGLDVRRTDGAHVEPSALLCLEQRGADCGMSWVMRRESSSHSRAAPGRRSRWACGHVVELVGGADQELADGVGEAVDGAAGVATGGLGREDEGGDDPHGGADEGLGEPLPGGRLRADRADAEDEHAADRHLDEVGTQPQELTDRDADQDEQAEAPPLEGYDGREPDGQHDAGHDGDDAVEPTGEQGHRRHLDDEHGGQRREQWLGAGEEERGDDVAGGRGDGDAQRPEHGGAAVTAYARDLAGDEPTPPRITRPSCPRLATRQSQ